MYKMTSSFADVIWGFCSFFVEAMNPSHYEVLGIHSLASQSEIRSAYRSMVMPSIRIHQQQCLIIFQILREHPDKAGRRGGLAGEGSEAYHRVREAWRVLRDPQLRGKYDVHLQGDTLDMRPCSSNAHLTFWIIFRVTTKE